MSQSTPDLSALTMSAALRHLEDLLYVALQAAMAFDERAVIRDGLRMRTTDQGLQKLAALHAFERMIEGMRKAVEAKRKEIGG